MIVFLSHLHVVAESIAHNKAVRHSDPVGLHGVPVPIVEVPNLRIIVVRYLHGVCMECWGHEPLEFPHAARMAHARTDLLLARHVCRRLPPCGPQSPWRRFPGMAHQARCCLQQRAFDSSRLKGGSRGQFWVGAPCSLQSLQVRFNYPARSHSRHCLILLLRAFGCGSMT